MKKIAVVDRISDLPESLLCHILSFLPTKKAVATSLLSSRWKLLWTLVPKLDLDSEKINTLPEDDDEECDIMFANIVSRVLAQQQCGELQSFRLQWQFGWDGSHLDAWLRTAAARKLKELYLDIHIGDDDVENLKLPPIFFSCRTLVVLNLSGDIDIDIDIDVDVDTPSLSFHFPSLKILHLLGIYLAEDSFLRLLCGCPILEDLSFTSEHFEGQYKICVPLLKRLCIHETEFNDSDYELEIYAPALEYFNFDGDLRDIKFHEKLDNLVQAGVYIDSAFEEHEECFRKRVFRLFAALNNVKFLSFSPSGIEGYDFIQSNLCWKEPKYEPEYLSSLTIFYYRGFKGLNDQVEFVKYILKEAKVLKTATIQVYKGESKESVLEKLSLFPRRSTTCLLRVE